MSIYRAGQLNTLGLTNPGSYIIENLPTSEVVGVATNIQGVVGVASWGPVGAGVPFGSLNSGVLKFGSPLIRSYDLVSYAVAGFQQGEAVNYVGVRVTDGTDTAATVVAALGGTFTAKYTGIRGNGIQVTIQPSIGGLFALVISIPGSTPERFDGLPATAGPFWAAVANAVNLGTSQRGPSNFVVFTVAGTVSLTPTAGAAFSLTGGTDGASGVTSSNLVGTSVRPRKGMYALAGTGCDAFALCDCVDTSTWPVQIAFGISQGMLAVTTTASGDTIANAVASRTSVGVDDRSLWIPMGDWPTVYDTVNGLSRLFSPQAVALGLLGNLSPEQSPINKPLVGVIGTQTSQTQFLTDVADESVAQTGGIDFIGRSGALNVNYFTFMTGRNASSNTQANEVNFTRLENYIARSLNGVATTQLVGLLQSQQLVDPTRTKAAAILSAFGAQLKDPASGSNGYGMIDDFSVLCDKTNNLNTNIQQGQLHATFTARFLSVVRYFIIDLTGGNNVNITISTTPTLAS